MGTTLSEPCIYDKLSESIDILRQSGYRYGMSEREIEKFIKQVLETNEPRRDPPQFPILRATIKFVVAVGFLVVVVLAFTYPQTRPQLGVTYTGGHNWSSPLSHIRLLALPIAKKYNLQGTVSMSGGVQGLCDRAWSTVLAVLRCPLCWRSLRPSESLQPCAEVHSLCCSRRFTSGAREKVLRWLFPKAELCPLLDSAGTTLQRCLVTHSANSQSRGVRVLGWLVVGEGLPTVRVVPVHRCQKHCSSFNLWLGPGDMVYADPRYWQMELFPSRDQNIVCDGSTF
ncbi:bombesin receptor-activated protein C6orf89 homolog isoform X2 [Salvelinus fontinalis]|uniref:bombesin receptor-activated protein C6orf89 homolog isoform X2 n=1 Tax=Salvelinus fontinalis TaxID=8038 RepID=UPI0024854319|nr:bombesin receptor-activated protein C6orf89 homolog isoform X2 [Salvelinus fontinalis]